MSCMRAKPRSRATRTEPPPPMKMPRVPSGSAKNVVSSATRICAAAAVSSPPPSVAPCSAAMKGMLPRAIASKKVLRLNGNGSRSERPFFQLSAAQRRSSPAQKLSPWPKMMPHFASSPARSIASRNCFITVGLKQLRLSGRLRPTRAISPSSSYVTVCSSLMTCSWFNKNTSRAGLRRQLCKGEIAAALRGGIAEQRGQEHRPLQIEADIVLVGETDRAVQLDAGLGDRERFIRGLGLGCDRQGGIDAEGFVVGRNLEYQRARRLDADVHVGGLVLQRLEAADRLSELLADAHVVERDLLRLVHHAQQLRRQRDQREMMQRLHRVPRRGIRRDEVGGCAFEIERRKGAAIHRRHARERAARRLPRDIAQQGSVAARGGNQEAVGAVG